MVINASSVITPDINNLRTLISFISTSIHEIEAFH
jgi:hypothetical protein